MAKETKQATLSSRTVPDIQYTVPDVFIFESLSEADEKAKRFEGQTIADMLRLAGKNPKYFYFQSESELPHLLGLFRESKYRFLHVSAHASDKFIGTTNGNLTYDRFSEIFEGHLQLRRLFFSACQIGNQSFVESVSKRNKGMHSIVAPSENIQFDHAAALWSSFYISIFTQNSNAMKHIDIETRLNGLCRLFPVDFFFAGYDSVNKNWKYKTIKKA
jgi:hypothetical protein